MIDYIFSGIVALILVGVLVAVLFLVIKIDNQRYKEHKVFKDNILKEIKRFNDDMHASLEYRKMICEEVEKWI